MERIYNERMPVYRSAADVVMDNGNIQQIGTPQEVFDHPANLFVAGFIEKNINFNYWKSPKDVKDSEMSSE